MDQFERTELLLGREAVEKLKNVKVAVFGLGGVGSYVAEALVRSGVGHFELIDNDRVSLTNLNRQLIALHSTIGKRKTEVCAARIHDINPHATCSIRNCFYLPETAEVFDFTGYDYVVDAVDTVTAKIDIIMRSKKAGVPVISAMGAGNKLDPTAFRVGDLFETSGDPLARVMRRELRKRGVTDLKVVYSTEQPVAHKEVLTEQDAHEEERIEIRKAGRGLRDPDAEIAVKKRAIPGSVAFVPSVAGLIIAGEVVKDLVCL